jgi:hypothetical protein
MAAEHPEETLAPETVAEIRTAGFERLPAAVAGSLTDALTEPAVPEVGWMLRITPQQVAYTLYWVVALAVVTVGFGLAGGPGALAGVVLGGLAASALIRVLM